MRFGIRKKIFIVTLVTSTLISFIIGFTIFKQAYHLFLNNFLKDKMALSRTIADALDGDDLARFVTPESLSDPAYREYQRYLNMTKNRNKEITILYAVVYDSDKGYYLYTVDAGINDENTLWVESESFSFICRIKGSGVEIEYEQELYTDDFSVKTDKGPLSVVVDDKAVYIADFLLFRVESSDPIVLSTAVGELSDRNGLSELSKSTEVDLAGKWEELSLTLCLKGLPESIPGEQYNRDDSESIEWLNEMIALDKDDMSEEFEETEYGDSLFISTVIHGVAGNPAGILMVEIWAREAQEFRHSIIVAALLVSVLAFVISVFVFLLVTEKMIIQSLKLFSAAVNEVGRGNFSFHLDIKRNDEIGDLASTFNNMSEGLKERDLVKDLFGKYVQKEVADLAMSSKLRLGGDKHSATVLFSDIRKFTTLSEGMEPKDLVSLLNRYFTRMVDCIVKHHGVLDKYIGDALMVYFGILGLKELPADSAVAAAIEMVRGLNDFNEKQKARGEAPINIGIGIHTGELVAGNIGAPNRMEYTVIGDTVNIASRAEGLTKIFGVRIIITESTFKELEGSYHIRPLDLIVVKGKSEPIQIYEIFDGDEDKSISAKEESMQELKQAVALYRKMEFGEAKKIFVALYERNRNDGLYTYFVEHCDFFIANPPERGWDGRAVMTSK